MKTLFGSWKILRIISNLTLFYISIFTRIVKTKNFIVFLKIRYIYLIIILWTTS